MFSPPPRAPRALTSNLRLQWSGRLRDIIKVTEAMFVEELPPGAVVCSEGEEGKSFYVLLSGVLEVQTAEHSFLKVGMPCQLACDCTLKGKVYPRGTRGVIEKVDLSRGFPYTFKVAKDKDKTSRSSGDGGKKSAVGTAGEEETAPRRNKSVGGAAAMAPALPEAPAQAPRSPSSGDQDNLQGVEGAVAAPVVTDTPPTGVAENKAEKVVKGRLAHYELMPLEDSDEFKPKTVAFLHPGDYFGEQSLLRSVPREASVIVPPNLVALQTSIANSDHDSAVASPTTSSDAPAGGTTKRASATSNGGQISPDVLLGKVIIAALDKGEFEKLNLRHQINFPKRAAVRIVDEDYDQRLAGRVLKKTDAEEEWLQAALTKNIALREIADLDEEQIKDMVSVAYKREVHSGEIVTKEGALFGTACYVVESGTYKCTTPMLDQDAANLENTIGITLPGLVNENNPLVDKWESVQAGGADQQGAQLGSHLYPASFSSMKGGAGDGEQDHADRKSNVNRMASIVRLSSFSSSLSPAADGGPGGDRVRSSAVTSSSGKQGIEEAKANVLGKEQKRLETAMSASKIPSMFKRAHTKDLSSNRKGKSRPGTGGIGGGPPAASQLGSGARGLLVADVGRGARGQSLFNRGAGSMLGLGGGPMYGGKNPPLLSIYKLGKVFGNAASKGAHLQQHYTTREMMRAYVGGYSKPGGLRPGDMFGLVSVLEHRAQFANVECASETGTLWVIDRAAFRSVLRKNLEQRINNLSRVIRNIPEFSVLLSEEVAALAEAFFIKSYRKGERVVAKDDSTSQTFYVLLSGEIEIDGRVVQARSAYTSLGGSAGAGADGADESMLAGGAATPGAGATSSAAPGGMNASMSTSAKNLASMSASGRRGAAGPDQPAEVLPLQDSLLFSKLASNENLHSSMAGGAFDSFGGAGLPLSYGTSSSTSSKSLKKLNSASTKSTASWAATSSDRNGNLPTSQSTEANSSLSSKASANKKQFNATREGPGHATIAPGSTATAGTNGSSSSEDQEQDGKCNGELPEKYNPVSVPEYPEKKLRKTPKTATAGASTNSTAVLSKAKTGSFGLAASKSGCSSSSSGNKSATSSTSGTTNPPPFSSMKKFGSSPGSSLSSRELLKSVPEGEALPASANHKKVVTVIAEGEAGPIAEGEAGPQGDRITDAGDDDDATAETESKKQKQTRSAKKLAHQGTTVSTATAASRRSATDSEGTTGSSRGSAATAVPRLVASRASSGQSSFSPNKMKAFRPPLSPREIYFGHETLGVVTTACGVQMEHTGSKHNVDVVSDTVVMACLSGVDYQRLLKQVTNELANPSWRDRQSGILAMEIKRDPKLEAECAALKPSQLTQVALLGYGGFGVVSLEKNNITGKAYAVKSVRKEWILRNNLAHAIISEKNLMLQCRGSDFIVKLLTTFNLKSSLCLVMEPMLGGEIYYTYMTKKFTGDSKKARFYAATCILAFAYMHERSILFRDLKPENLLLDGEGRCKLTDFGLAKKSAKKTYTTCGTPDYYAPEIVMHQGHSFGVDWWTLGVLIHELMSGHPPFEANVPMKTYALIRRGVDYVRFPYRGSDPVCMDLVQKLLQQEPAERLPMKTDGMTQLRQHPWYSRAQFLWSSFESRKMPVPYKPDLKSNFDTKAFHKIREADLPPDVVGSGGSFEEPEEMRGWDYGF